MSRRPPTPMADWQLEQGRPLWGAGEMDDEKREWVRAVLQTLPNTPEQPHMAVVEMRIWGKYTFKEIADELGLKSKANAHDLYYRALRWLRDGRVAVVGKGEHKFKVQMPGLGEGADEWL